MDIRHDHRQCIISRSFAEDIKPKTPEWRKYQLDNLSAKLSRNIESKSLLKGPGDEYQKNCEDVNIINSDEELQPMWRDMESRVINRKPWTVQQSASKGRMIGRGNVKRTDEEMWLDAGLYTKPSCSEDESDNETTKSK